MISIIIPLYNERENIIRYQQDLFPIIDNIAVTYNEKIEYIMIDDGSKDDTVAQLRKVANGRSDTTILYHEINRGMGNAIKTGVAASKGEFIITMDADLTFRPADVSKLIESSRETGADSVYGSPYLQKGLIEEVPPFRLFLSKTVNFLYRLFPKI